MVQGVQKIRMWVWAAVAMAACILAGGCSAPLVPPARMPSVSRRAMPDDKLLAGLQQDWLALQNTRLSAGQRDAVVSDYNRKLLILLKRYRVDILSHEHGRGGSYPAAVQLVIDAPLRSVYDDIVPSADIRCNLLEEHYTVPGVGVPMVGIIPASKAAKIKDVHAIRTQGTVRNLTAVLEFPKGAAPSGAVRPRLHLIHRNRQETLRIGRLEYQLAGDFSAAIEQYWDLTQVEKWRFLGLLRPQKLRSVTGLSCMEGYDPDKIPVILTHGLLSSAGTFNNLANRLTNDPDIRRNYQFWYFNYPTGVSWTVNAAAYRKSLQQLRDQVDPRHTNRNWDRMVVVGHSMGGLITHYSQCTEPWMLLQGTTFERHCKYHNLLSGYYVDHAFPNNKFDNLRSNYYFRPVQAGMVIYLATPHQGAPLARYRIAVVAMRLVRLPQNIIDEAVHLATLQQDNVVFNPRQLTQWFTSVNQLSPESYSIRGLKRLAVRDVPTYSVIGNARGGPVARSSDGVVPYWSSHIARGGQKVVRWDHSVQDAPGTAKYLRTLLLDYLPRDRKRSNRR